MKILTGIDLPFNPSCGSMILCDDLYYTEKSNYQIKFLALNSNNLYSWSKLRDVCLIGIEKIYDPDDYHNYVLNLRDFAEGQVRKFKPDIIHIQHLGFGMALALADIENIPKIAICHGTDVLFSLKNEFHKNNLLKILNSVQCVISPTQKMLTQLLSIIPPGGVKNYEIVPWGISDLVIENAQPRTWFQSGKYLLYAGRLADEKNIHVLFKAITLLDENINLTVVGDGDEKDRLKRIVDVENLHQRIYFEDFLPREELWKRFKNFDAIVIPTKEVEAFCLIAIEAQSYGLPIIHSNTGGLEEVIGDTGIIFDNEDPGDLARKIQLLFSDTAMMNKLSRKGLQNVEKYKISNTQKRFFEISQKIISHYNSV